jgi:hypothetical protein
LRIWIAAFLLLGLAAAGLAMLPRAIDWSTYRADIEASASELSGHEVTIGGPIDVRLLPRPTVSARDVAMSGKADDDVSFELAAGQVEATLEIVPFLAGRPAFRDLKLRRPVLSLNDGGDDSLLSWPPNWQDWLAPFLNLDLNGITIANGKVELVASETEAVALSDISLEIQTNKETGPLEAAGLFRTERYNFTIKSMLGRPDAMGLRAAKLTIDAQNGVDVITSARFSGSIRLSGDDSGLQGQLSLTGPDLQQGLSAVSSATGYSSTFRSIAKSQGFDIRGTIQADDDGLRAERFQIALADKRGEGAIDLRLHPQRRLDLDIDLPSLRLADDAIITDFLPLDLLSKLQVPPGRIDIRFREILLRDEAVHQGRFALQTSADGSTTVEQAKARFPGLIDAQFTGQVLPGNVGPRLKGQLNAVGDDLGRSLVWLGLIDTESGGDGWRGISLEGKVDVSSVEISLSDIDMRLASSKLEGRVGLRFGEQMTLSLDTDVDRLNLDRYSGLWQGDGGARQLLDRFAKLETQVSSRFKRLIWDDIHIEEATISAGIKGGKIEMESIAAKTVGETAFDLSGHIDFTEETTKLKGNLTSQHPIRALRHVGLNLPPSSARVQPIEVTGHVDGRLERFDLELDADYDGGQGRIDGQAGFVDDDLHYDLAMTIRHPDHLSLASHFGLAPLLPIGDADGDFELTGQIRSDDKAPLLASGSAKLGPSTFTGSLTYVDDAPVGPWELKLSVGAPKWDSLNPFLTLAGLRSAADWTPDRWLGRLPTIGLRTSWLDDVEGSVSLASKGGLAGSGVQLSARLVDGLLYVNRLEAAPWNGQMTAEFTLERRRDQPFAAFAIDLDQVEAADLGNWLGVKDGLEGLLDLEIEASAVGSTPYQMMSSLFGDMKIAIGEGEARGLGIPPLRRTLIPKEEGSLIDRSLSQPFDRIALNADISRGILTLEDSTMSIGRDADEDMVEAAIEGTIDLLLWIADLTLTPRNADAGLGGEAEPRVYRVVGPPDRPDGFTSAGN